MIPVPALIVEGIKALARVLQVYMVPTQTALTQADALIDK
jgi:hypothetical protein